MNVTVPGAALLQGSIQCGFSELCGHMHNHLGFMCGSGVFQLLYGLGSVLYLLKDSQAAPCHFLHHLSSRLARLAANGKTGGCWRRGSSQERRVVFVKMNLTEALIQPAQKCGVLSQRWGPGVAWGHGHLVGAPHGSSASLL